MIRPSIIVWLLATSIVCVLFLSAKPRIVPEVVDTMNRVAEFDHRVEVVKTKCASDSIPDPRVDAYLCEGVVKQSELLDGEEYVLFRYNALQSMCNVFEYDTECEIVYGLDENIE